MHAAFRILVKGGLSASFIRVSGAPISNPMQRGTRRRSTTSLLAVFVRRSHPTDQIRSKHSARRNFQPDLIRIVRWCSADMRSCTAGRDPLQRNWRSRCPYRRRALLVAHAPCTTSSKPVLISCASVILSIVSVIFFAIPQSFAQEISASQAPLLTDKQTFQQIEDRWREAINKRDQYSLELVLTPELIDISATGTVTTRDQQIAILLQRHTESLLLDQHVVYVRSFGDIAVVIGNYVEQPPAREKVAWRSGMFTHIYRRVHGRWSCISAQRTAIADPSPQKARRAEK
jgi:hypothetical protein